MRNLGVTIVVAVVLGVASLAPAQDMRFSANWENGWEFDTDPTGGWSINQGNPDLITTVADGVLTFEPSSAWNVWDTGLSGNPLGTGDWSIEWRVSVGTSSGGNPLLYADTNSINENVSFTTGFAGGGQMYGKYQIAPCDTDCSLDSGGWTFPVYHVYRLTRTTGVVGTLFSLYVGEYDNSTATVTKDVLITTKDTTDRFLLGNGTATGLYRIDYIRWTTTGAYVPVDPVDIDGTVVLGDYLGDVSELSVKIELRQGGVLKRSEVRPLSATGTFSLDHISPPGTYDVTAKIIGGVGWLQKVLLGVDISTNPTNLTIDMINGDCNGDNAITNLDLSIVLAGMDEMGD
ncbi:MAG: hypothetical protein WC975_15170 [Phycisphaerae bacterium]